LLEYTQAT